MNPIIKDIWATRISVLLWIGALIGFISVLVSFAFGAELELVWGAPLNSNVVFLYQVHYGTNKRTSSDPLVFHYQRTNSTSKTNFSMVVSNLGAGKWYFSAASLSSNGTISSFTTNEVAFTNEALAPAGFSAKNIARLWQIPPGAILQRTFDFTNWFEHIRNFGSNTAVVRISDDAFGRMQFYRLWTNIVQLPPLP